MTQGQVAGSNAGQYIKCNEKNSIRSNLRTGQYAGSISSDHSQEQALVEPLGSPDINKFLCKATQKRGSGLAKLNRKDKGKANRFEH